MRILIGTVALPAIVRLFPVRDLSTKRTNARATGATISRPMIWDSGIRPGPPISFETPPTREFGPVPEIPEPN